MFKKASNSVAMLVILREKPKTKDRKASGSVLNVGNGFLLVLIVGQICEAKRMNEFFVEVIGFIIMMVLLCVVIMFLLGEKIIF